MQSIHYVSKKQYNNVVYLKYQLHSILAKAHTAAVENSNMMAYSGIYSQQTSLNFPIWLRGQLFHNYKKKRK